MINKQTKNSILAEVAEGDLSTEQIARKHNVSRSAIKTWLKNVPVQTVPNQPKPDFGNMPQRKTDPIKMLQGVINVTSSHDTDDDYRQISIDTDKPIAVMKAADLHLGGLDVDYPSLLANLKFLLETPNFYLQLFGDDLNLMVMHKNAGARHDILTPEQQINLLTGIVDTCLERGKIISMAWGNHSDEFTERNAGFGIVRALMKYKVPYFRGLGYIDLKVGKNIYPMAFTHKTRFNSFMNALHGNKRMEQLHKEFFGGNRPLAKEYITAHTHYPAWSAEGCLPEERVYYIKCGTFKTNCLYSQRYYGQGRIGVPTVVYHPDRFEHVCLPTPWEAYRYLTGKDYHA